MAKNDTLFITKTAEIHGLLGQQIPIAYIRQYPAPLARYITYEAGKKTLFGNVLHPGYYNMASGKLVDKILPWEIKPFEATKTLSSLACR